MNPGTALTLWSFRKELKLVLIVFAAVLLLPVVIITMMTQVGIDLVSDKLVSQNLQTQVMQIQDPVTGRVIKTITSLVVWPTKGIITLNYGESSIYQPFHTGIDIAGNKGEVVNPAMDGTVVYAGETLWGFGKHVVIDHGNNVQTVYAHLDDFYVVNGQKVTTGSVIGGQGQTGWATGVHLHFQVNVFGIPVNPRVLLGG